jgi:prepilin-type N-terminal cleavage/methylation domain-containing protein
MDKRRGFTLVELLVVIAIIALLMSILMPALGRVRKQAKSVLCQSNMKQWGNCYAMYADAWDGSTPAGWLAGTNLPSSMDYAKCYWMEALRPYYMNEHDLRCCPMAAKPGTKLGLGPWGGVDIAWGVFGEPGELDRIGEPYSWAYVVIGDYGSTGNNGWVADPPPNVTPADLGEDHPVAWNWRNFNISGAGQVPLHGDNQWIDCWPMVTDEIPLYEDEEFSVYSAYSHMVRICINRHDGFVNWVFMDYSVRPVGLKELWNFKWHRGYDMDEGPTTEEFNIASGNYDGWLRKFRNYD